VGVLEEEEELLTLRCRLSMRLVLALGREEVLEDPSSVAGSELP
jgi:hypothetical protein